MERQYYALISSLPELSLNDTILKYDLVSYREMLKSEVDKADFEFLAIAYFKFDILNFVKLAKEEDTEWNNAGNLSKEELTEGMAQPELLPKFFQDFLELQPQDWKDQPRKTLINALTSCYLDWSRNIDNAFLKEWISFQQNLKNLLIWHNTSKFNKDTNAEVLGSSYEAEYLRSVDKSSLDLKAWDFAYKEILIHLNNPNIALREFLIDKMRWNFLQELEENYYFNKERLLAFAVKLQIVNRNIITTEKKGKERLNELLSDIKEGYALPEMFT
jgi:hypothetical protein